ncbi:MAG: 50S ribosomal protein L9 [Clostridia bacterium]|nr:50S ribosomal protein L9 [Clostridia bacterium]
MEVILLQDVKTLGKKNQIVKVSDGYARNFLFPKKLAVEANAVNKNAVEIHNKSEENKRKAEKARAEEDKKLLEGKVFTVKAKGSSTKLFGAITSKEIAEEIEKDSGLAIDKKKINVANIKTYGEYIAEIKLYPETAAKVTVHVVPEE